MQHIHSKFREREMYNVSQSYIDSKEYMRNYVSIPRRSFEQSAPTREKRRRLQGGGAL